MRVGVVKLKMKRMIEGRGEMGDIRRGRREDVEALKRITKEWFEVNYLF